MLHQIGDGFIVGNANAGLQALTSGFMRSAAAVGAMGATALLVGETDGFAIDATTAGGTISVKSSNSLTSDNVPINPFLTQSGTSPKLTRWNDGTLKWSAHNLHLHSEDFTTRSLNSNVTVTANDAVAPDGTTTADKCASTSSDAFIRQAAAGSIVGATYTFSIWLKADSAVSVRIYCINPVTFTDCSVTTAWQQFTLTVAVDNVNPGWQLGGGSSFSTGEAVYAWGAQVNRGTVPTDYLATTTAAKYTVAQEYDGTEFGILVEPAGTNLCLRSDDFTNASWTKSNLTAVKTATGPDGGTNSASTLTATAGNATALQSITSASSVRITSMWVKRRTGSGNIDITQNNGTNWSTVTATGSWTRVNLAPATAANPTVGIRIVTSGDEVDVFGFQHELGGAPTSTIPTAAATVTRAADAPFVLVSAIPWDATQWSFFAKGNSRLLVSSSTGNVLVGVDDDTSNERAAIILASDVNGGHRLIVFDGGASQANIGEVTATDGVDAKLAARIKANDFALSQNGNTPVTDTSGTLPTVTHLTLGCRDISDPIRHLNGLLKKVVVVPRTWNNTELQARTA